jgi:peroxiredoxin
LVGYEKAKPDLDAIGAKVVAASVDPIDKAREVATEVSFPIGYGVTREIADKLGSWREERRQFIQPSDFVVGADVELQRRPVGTHGCGRYRGADPVLRIKK